MLFNMDFFFRYYSYIIAFLYKSCVYPFNVILKVTFEKSLRCIKFALQQTRLLHPPLESHRVLQDALKEVKTMLQNYRGYGGQANTLGNYPAHQEPRVAPSCEQNPMQQSIVTQGEVRLQSDPNGECRQRRNIKQIVHKCREGYWLCYN